MSRQKAVVWGDGGPRQEVTLMVQDLSDRSQVVFDDEPLMVEVDVIRL